MAEQGGAPPTELGEMASLPPPRPPPPGEHAEKRDRISELPDEILIHILGFLPTAKLCASTSILSRRWRHLWTHTPVLDLRGEGFVLPHNDRAVDCCIRACRAASLLRFAVDILPAGDFMTDDGDIDVESTMDEARSRAERWVRFAASRSVEELCLIFFPMDVPLLEPPPSVLACGQLLTALKLTRCDLGNFPCRPGGFPSLRILQLVTCTLPEEKLRPLLSMCPLLERLSLQYFLRLSIEVSSTINPRLRDLRIWANGMTISVDVPDLRSFDLHEMITSLSLNGEPPRLREVELHSPHWHEAFFGKQVPKKILPAVIDVEIFSVNNWFLEV